MFYFPNADARKISGMTEGGVVNADAREIFGITERGRRERLSVKIFQDDEERGVER
jgi:hypothetical protein